VAKGFISTSPRVSAPSGIQFAEQRDFTGGLNFRADQFQLAPNESPFILNMEVDPRGGVFSRAGYQTFNSTAVSGTWNPKALFNYKYVGNPHIMLTTGYVTSGAVNGKVMYANSASHDFVNLNSAVLTPLAVKSLNGAGMTQWEDTLYIALGKDATQMYKWTVGNTYATALLASGPTWQQYTLPVGGYMPRAELAIAHANKLFVANTKELNSDATPSVVDYPNRLRWSHENLPEDWYVDDYIDIIAGGEGIRGLAVVDGQLLIFKPKAVYLLMGYDADSFQLVEVTKFVGIDTPQQCVEGDGGIYFFDYPKGLYFYDRNGLQNIYGRLDPTVTQNEINAQELSKITLGFVNNRLWMSAPYDWENTKVLPIKATVNFIYDKSIGQEGAYTMFQSADEFGLYAGCDWFDSDEEVYHLMINPDDSFPYIYMVDEYESGNVPVEAKDDVLEGATPNSTGSFTTNYTTSWFYNDRYVQDKTFVKPLFVVRNVLEDTQVIINVYHDFNSTTVANPTTLILDAAQSGGVYGTAIYGTSIYGIDSLPTTIQAGSRLKKAKSVQLEFIGPTDLNSNSAIYPGRYWGINSIAYKFKSRRVRSQK
jgi:hypothetical protein